jgi:hypothetical protein
MSHARVAPLDDRHLVGVQLSRRATSRDARRDRSRAAASQPIQPRPRCSITVRSTTSGIRPRPRCSGGRRIHSLASRAAPRRRSRHPRPDLVLGEPALEHAARQDSDEPAVLDDGNASVAPRGSGMPGRAGSASTCSGLARGRRRSARIKPAAGPWRRAPSASRRLSARRRHRRRRRRAPRARQHAPPPAPTRPRQRARVGDHRVADAAARHG